MGPKVHVHVARSKAIFMLALRMRFLRICTAGALAWAVPVVAQPARDPELPTLPLCEVFKDLRSYSGKIVSLWGQLYSGSEVAAIGGHCDNKFVTKYSRSPDFPLPLQPQLEYVWPTALNLVMSSSVERIGEKLDFRTAAADVDRVYDQIHRERAKFGKQDVETWVTVVGKLQDKDHYDIGQSPDGKVRGDGYGHLSTYPGQLVIKTMRDPLVVPKTTERK